MTDDALSLVLFSGTDDKLHAAAVLTVGAAAMARPVDIFLQYWALDCVPRRPHPEGPRRLAGGGSPRARASMRDQGKTHWSELFRQAKDLGEVRIHACSDSMEMFHITTTTSIRWSTASGASRASSWKPTAP